MNSLQSVVLTLSLSYALIGALLLVVLVYARLPWSAKAVAVVVTSAFYIASFVGVRGLLGWASVDRLPCQPSSCCRPVSSSRTRWKAIRARSISGSRRSTTAIGRAAFPGPIGFPTATGSRKRPTRRRARSPPGAPRAVAPPISAAAKAACSRPPGSTSRPTSSSRRRAAIPRRAGACGGAACRRRGVVYAAAAAANAAEGRAIGRNGGRAPREPAGSAKAPVARP